MFRRYRSDPFRKYNEGRNHFLANIPQLIAPEKYFSDALHAIVSNAIPEIIRDYNEASNLFPFWQNYPPEERGRQHRGDRFPWIEVGEHTIGDKLPRLLERYGYTIGDAGLPTGPDKRFVLSHGEIARCPGGYTDAAWLFVDSKSVGPRDDFDNTVMSHNSGLRGRPVGEPRGRDEKHRHEDDRAAGVSPVSQHTTAALRLVGRHNRTCRPRRAHDLPPVAGPVGVRVG